MPHAILIHGERVRTFDTREECVAVALRQCWGRLDEAGTFVPSPGTEIVPVDPTAGTDPE